MERDASMGSGLVGQVESPVFLLVGSLVDWSVGLVSRSSSRRLGHKFKSLMHQVVDGALFKSLMHHRSTAK